MNPIYLKLDETQSVTVFPTPLEREGYMVKVVEMEGKINDSAIPKNNSELFLCCDFCEESYVGNTLMPVLRKIKTDGNGNVLDNLHQSIWVKVMRPTITRISVFICNDKGQRLSLSNKHLKCTLVFVPTEKKWL